jgi:hypothetical protein
MTDSGVKKRFLLLLSRSVQFLAQFPAQRSNGAKVKRNCLRPMAFRPHFSMGLALSKTGNDLVRLPSDISLREANVRHLETGPLHDFLEKGFE